MPVKNVVRKLEITPSMTRFDSDKVQKFAESLGFDLTEQELRANRMNLIAAMESKANCDRCKGLETCLNEPAGMRAVAEQYRGWVQVAYGQCARSKAYERQKKNEAILASSRMPPKMRHKTLAGYHVTKDNRQALERAQEAVEGDRGLMLIGSPGTGKTHLAVAIANERLAQGREAIFTTVPELMAEIRQAMRRGEDTELIELVKTCELLVLDDLGAERTTDWVMEQLFMIVNARYLGELQTVVTSNYSQSELIAQMGNLPGQRIISRLSEMCQAVRVDGRDWRLGGYRNAK